MLRRPLLAVAVLSAMLAPAAAQAPKPKPYAAVPVTFADDTPKEPAFAAFRRDLTQAVARKDRAAVAKLVLPGFFWARDFGGGFDKAKSAVANFEAAIGGLAEGDFAALGALVAHERVGREPAARGALCAPAPPRFDTAAFDKVLELTDSDGLDWGVPVRAGVIVRAAPKADAAVVTTLAVVLVRGLEWWAAGAPDASGWHRVATPTGAAGYVAAAELLTLTEEKLCYAKGADGRWGIAGYVGGGD